MNIGFGLALSIISIALGIFTFHKKRYAKLYPKWIVVCMTIAIAASGYVSVKLMDIIMPKITELITITALNQKNENSNDSEIFFYGVKIGDKEKVLPLDIVSGNWFERGDMTGWIRSDRQGPPPDLTQEIQVRIPVGKDRKLIFANNDWRGFAEISYREWTFVNDCYSPNAYDQELELPPSPTGLILLNVMLICAENLLLLAVFSLLSVLAIKKCYQNQKGLANHWDKCVFAFACIFFLVLNIKTANIHSFWLDEMFQIGFVHESLTLYQILRYRLMETSPPLYSLFFAVWYRLVPYGQTWLLLPSIISTSIGIYFTGLLGSMVRNKRTGVMAVCFCVTSSIVIGNMAHEIRSYAFMFMFSAITLYLYVLRNSKEKNGGKFYRIIYGVAMLLLCFSHYFGVPLCAGLFVSDGYLYIKKKIPLKYISSYFIMGIPVFTWFIIQLKYGPLGRGALDNFFTSTPAWNQIYDLPKFLSGNNEVVFLFFILGMCFVLISELVLLFKSKEIQSGYILLAITATFILSIAIIYYYSTELNPNGSLFVGRYFICFYPVTAVLSALGVDIMCSSIDVKKKNGAVVSIALCAAIIVYTAYPNYVNAYVNTKSDMSFRESANWLMTKSNIYYSDTAVAVFPPEAVVAGYNYYLTKRGRIYPPNIVFLHEAASSADEILDALEGYNHIYLAQTNILTPEIINIFNQNYKKTFEDANLKIMGYEREG